MIETALAKGGLTMEHVAARSFAIQPPPPPSAIPPLRGGELGDMERSTD